MTVSEGEIATLKALAEGVEYGAKWYTADELMKHRAMENGDAAFIAALNPATVLRILEDREAAEEIGAQSAVQLDEAANIIAGYGLTSLAGIFRKQASAQRAFLSTGKPSKAKETADG